MRRGLGLFGLLLERLLHRLLRRPGQRRPELRDMRLGLLAGRVVRLGILRELLKSEGAEKVGYSIAAMAASVIRRMSSWTAWALSQSVTGPSSVSSTSYRNETRPRRART